MNTDKNQLKSICLITCYMGPLPVYFDYFVASCRKNPDINFVVVNDHIQSTKTIDNVKLIKMNLEEFNVLASQKLNVAVKLQSAWKINEIKPLFGIIFSEWLINFDFWGWCDLDIIWGKIRNFLTPNVLATYDVITSKKYWSAGHFTMFKNNSLCNTLYSRYPKVIELLNNPVYFAFEESCHRWDNERFTFKQLDEMNLPVSMYDIIKTAEDNGEIKAHFKDIIREHPQPINYSYKNGVLTDLANNQEFMYYHLITIKKIWRFYIPKYQNSYDNLIMTPYGIRGENENKPVWYAYRAYSCYKGIRKSIKKQNTSDVVKKLFGLKRD